MDLARALRELVLLQHRFTQRQSLSCELVVRLLPGEPMTEDELRAALWPRLGDRDEGKVAAWSSGLLLED